MHALPGQVCRDRADGGKALSEMRTSMGTRPVLLGLVWRLPWILRLEGDLGRNMTRGCLGVYIGTLSGDRESIHAERKLENLVFWGFFEGFFLR